MSERERLAELLPRVVMAVAYQMIQPNDDEHMRRGIELADAIEQVFDRYDHHWIAAHQARLDLKSTRMEIAWMLEGRR